MAILAGDIKLLKSAEMADVPEGGGAPTGLEVVDGVSNAIFKDISDLDRAGGRVNLRKVITGVLTDNTDAYLGSNVIVAEPPKDPLVSVSLFSTGQMFDTRADAVSKIEGYLGLGSRLSGYLLENHIEGQGAIQLFQRPGTQPPNIGRTLALVLDEGLSTEKVQYVRTTSVTTETRTFADPVTGNEFLASVVTLELSDTLRYSFTGSPPSRFFTQVAGKTVMRDTRVADSGTYCGVSPLAIAADLGASQVKVDSIYTQLVPNARTESPSLDQKPAAQRLVTLATSPRLVQVSGAPHTMSIRVGQENRGFSWVQMLKPLPSAGSIIASYMALGSWYTMYDDGLGHFTGAGVGTVDYTTGSISLTLTAMPDADTSIIINWGENTAYTNRAGQAGFRAPEFAWATPHSGLKPGTIVITWLSAGVLKTATDNGSGGITGHATGEVDYAAGKIYLRPSAMIDAGGQFQTAYEYAVTRTETFTAPALDAGGFATLTLAEAPAPKSIVARWITDRSVSASSGTSEIVSSGGTGTPSTVEVGSTSSPGNVLTASDTYVMPGATIGFTLQTVLPQTPGTYTWSIDAYTLSGDAVDDALVLGGATGGTFTVTPKQVSRPDGTPGMVDDPSGACVGLFSLTVAADCPDLRFTVWAANQALTPIAASTSIEVDAVGNKPAPPWATKPPPPVIAVRDPVTGTGTVNTSQAVDRMEHGGWASDNGARVYVKVPRTVLPAGSIYADAQGMGYDLPSVYTRYWDEASQSFVQSGDMSVRWTPSDFAAGFKNIISVAGVDTKFYLWK